MKGGSAARCCACAGPSFTDSCSHAGRQMVASRGICIGLLITDCACMLENRNRCKAAAALRAKQLHGIYGPSRKLATTAATARIWAMARREEVCIDHPCAGCCCVHCVDIVHPLLQLLHGDLCISGLMPARNVQNVVHYVKPRA